MKLKNCTAESFITSLNNKEVICFGAGTTLIEADFEVLVIPELEKHIAFFVDNDKKKYKIKYNYRGKLFDILSPEIFGKIDCRKYVLLITCASYIEVYKQLSKIDEISDMDCYMYNCICSYPDLDIEAFFTTEIEKRQYADYRGVLQRLNLKNKHYGERCFILGNGPSLTVDDLELLKNEVTFASNRIFKVFPQTDWRPTYYLCTDYLMYGIDHEEINDIDAQLRFVPIERALAAGKVYDEITYYNRLVNCTSIVDGNVSVSEEFQFSDNIIDCVYGGQTVLYDAFQLAVYMGFKSIYLIGVDNSYKKELKKDGTIIDTGIKANHFCDAYDEGLQDKIAVVARLYLTEIIFRTVKEECEKRGVDVINATRGGNLNVFKRMELEEILFKNAIKK